MLSDVRFKDTTSAVDFLLANNVKGHPIDHRLEAKKKEAEGSRASDNWIILPKGCGRCIIAVEKCGEEIFNLSHEYATAIHVPAGSAFSFEALSAITFTSFQS